MLKFPKANRVFEKAYRKWIAQFPCCTCGRSDGTVVGHHLSVERGAGFKSSDEYLVPLCFWCHSEFHDRVGNEEKFFRQYGVYNAVELAGKYRAKYLQEQERRKQ